ncbi:MAG: hypothetical protein WB952_08700 [Terriglobales bacterium]
MPSQTAAVPHLVQFSGVIRGVDGAPRKGLVGITFALYKEEQGGAPLWLETQNVQLDAQGRYSVYLGDTKSNGLPPELFASGEARWLGVRPENQDEQPRSLLLSVPYALKAGDAATLGGLPASAFLLVAGAAPVASPAAAASNGNSGANLPPPAPCNVTSDNTAVANQVAKFSAPCNVEPSAITETGGQVGINNSAPSATLDVKGSTKLRGKTTLPAVKAATASKGSNSQPLVVVSSAFSSGTTSAVSQNFELQAEPLNNNTATPSGTLNLLFAQGSGTYSETGLNIASNGQIHFAAGQTFPGTGSGNGSVTSVGSGVGLTGGPITTSGSLSIDPAVVPELASNNIFTGIQTFNNNNIFNGSNTFTGDQTVNGSIISNVIISAPLMVATGLHVNGDMRVDGGLSLGSSGAVKVDAPFVPGGRFTILTDGSVGINNTAPATTLDVGGDINGSGNLTIAGNIGSGTLTVAGKVSGPNGVSLPIAYGMINANGTVSKATSNVSVSWDATNKWYAITIAGINYNFVNFVTQVTATFSNAVPQVTANVGSVSGNLLVQLHDSAGNAIQNPFQFVTFQP